MPKNYGYIRVSTIDQMNSGLSLPAQEARAKQYFEYQLAPKGIEWGGIFTEGGVSAYKKPLLLRPAGQQLNSVLAAGDHVSIVRMCRGFRNVRDFSTVLPIWESKGITIHFLDQLLDLSTANGKLCANMMVSIAQWESDIKSERMKETFAFIRSQGKSCNVMKLPDGKKYPRSHPKVREWLSEVIRMRDEEDLNWSQIALKLNRKFCIAAGEIPRRIARSSRGPINPEWCRRAYKFEKSLRFLHRQNDQNQQGVPDGPSPPVPRP